MTDAVRQALRKGSIPNGELEILAEILTVLLIDEQAVQNAVDLNCIALTYFDRLLEAIISRTSKEIAANEPQFEEIHAKAATLQHRWQQRFKERYFSIDGYRIKDMRSRALRDLTLNLSMDLEHLRDLEGKLWLVSRNEPISHKEGDLGFETGRQAI
jgi:chemotaxis regulatin CheY-phosphate phosphatase CheZ